MFSDVTALNNATFLFIKYTVPYFKIFELEAF